jgi:hypothetical protein
MAPDKELLGRFSLGMVFILKWPAEFLSNVPYTALGWAPAARAPLWVSGTNCSRTTNKNKDVPIFPGACIY